MSDEMIGGIGLLLAIAGVLMFLGLAAWSDHMRGAFRENCLTAGGIPIEDYCVKPGSFIEVKRDRF